MKAILQDLFDKILEHSRRQDRPALDGRSQCSYRVPNTDLKCFVGALIDDAYCTKELEHKNANREIVLVAVIKSQRLTISNDTEQEKLGIFLVQAQQIHDTRSPETWEDDLKDLANKWHLIYKESDHEYPTTAI